MRTAAVAGRRPLRRRRGDGQLIRRRGTGQRFVAGPFTPTYPFAQPVVQVVASML
ncbi:hypothetical protein [Lysobacter gummosus]|uniref:hypothetical protein n=1 Tax=Lysobacter gummosus TaxID=262324 RepID=UPI003643713F